MFIEIVIEFDAIVALDIVIELDAIVALDIDMGVTVLYVHPVAIFLDIELDDIVVFTS